MFFLITSGFFGCGDSESVSEDVQVANGEPGKDGANGINGSNGTNGANGITTIFDAQEEPAGVNCETGGTAITYGLDLNSNGILDVGEAVSVFYLCNGADGEDSEGPINYWGDSEESPFTYDGDLSFSHFGEMLAFCGSYVAIDGNLTINSTLLTHTEDLACLEAISGEIRIENNERLDLIRFENLKVVGGGITISDNSLLDTVLFDNLIHTNTSVLIQNHETLKSLQMPKLEFIGFDFLQEGDFLLYNNPSLHDLRMETLEVVQNDFVIDNSGLVDITGLDMLTHVGDGFQLSNNAVLETLSSLTSLERTGLDLRITDNPVLLNIDGLSGFYFVGGGFEIQNNEQLQSINLPSLDYIGSSRGMTVSTNPLLQVLLIPALYTVYGDIWVEYNDALSIIDISALKASNGIFISNNAVLTGVDLSALLEANDVHFTDNAALTSLSLASLDIATNIHITNNLLLQSVDLSSLTTLRRYISVSEHPALTTFTITSLSSLEHQNWFGEYYLIVSFVNNPQLLVDQTFFGDIITTSLGNTCESFGYTCTSYSGNL